MDFDTRVAEPPHVERLVAIEPDDGDTCSEQRLRRGDTGAGEADDENATAGELASSHEGKTKCRKSR